MNFKQIIYLHLGSEKSEKSHILSFQNDNV